jgi:hypothetical protein
MSELNSRRWAVQSEYGREAAGLTYEEAAALVSRLRAEKADKRSAGGNSKRARRGRKKGEA